MKGHNEEEWSLERERERAITEGERESNHRGRERAITERENETVGFVLPVLQSIILLSDLLPRKRRKLIIILFHGTFNCISLYLLFLISLLFSSSSSPNDENDYLNIFPPHLIPFLPLIVVNNCQWESFQCLPLLWNPTLLLSWIAEEKEKKRNRGERKEIEKKEEK